MGYGYNNRRNNYRRNNNNRKKKPYKKRNKRKRWSIPTAIGKFKLIKMNYSASERRTPLAIADAYVFRSNSIFDPDLTSAGHQPMSHDQWATFFERYYVYACAIKVNIVNLTAIPLEFVLYAQEDTVTVATLELAMEMKGRKFVVVPGSSGSSTKSISMWISTKQIVGRRTKFDDIFHANFGANLATTTQYHLFTAAADAATNVDYQIDASLVYFVKMYRPVTFGAS